MRPSRYLFALGAIYVVLFGIVLGSIATAHFHRTGTLTPKLGLDLIGGTTLTLTAQDVNGKPPTAENLELARQIIEERVNGLGVSEAEVVVEQPNNIVVSVPGQNNNTISNVGTPAQMRFRKVINAVADTGSTTAPTATPTPSGSASPSQRLGLRLAEAQCQRQRRSDGDRDAQRDGHPDVHPDQAAQ